MTAFAYYDVTCRDLTDRARTYRAGLTLRQTDDTGFRCAKCGELVPAAGNAIHDVRRVSKRDAADH